jgi:hypothetical protein
MAEAVVQQEGEGPMKNNLANVKRSKNGTLMGTSFEVFMCDDCSAAHFEIRDKIGEPFCVALIPPEHFLEVASSFAELAKYAETNGMIAKRSS